MNADQIFEAVKARHFGKSWLVIGEAPTTTGWGQRAGRIDAYAVGLWAENRGFIAYEIKISRQDFLKDLEQFAVKQAVALANSTQFYYAAPYGLLRADEMPEGCGLLEIQNGRTVITKAAAIRQLDGMNPRFIAAMRTPMKPEVPRRMREATPPLLAEPLIIGGMRRWSRKRVLELLQ